MSSKTIKHVIMRVVVSSLNEADVLSVQEQLLSFNPDLHFSPMREQPSLDGCIEFQASGHCDKEIKAIMVRDLDNDWDHDEDETEFWAYGFNTRMFNPLVYYMSMDFS